MTLKDEWMQRKSEIVDRRKAEDVWMASMDTFVAWVDSIRQRASEVPPAEVALPVAPTPPTVIEVTGQVVTTVTSSTAPRGASGVVPRVILDEIVRWTAVYREDPAVILAIALHETGWFDGLPKYPSPAWTIDNNPGGMKHAPAQFEGVLTTSPGQGSQYLHFACWQDGIRGLCLFLQGPLYVASWSLPSPLDTIQTIGRAGYCEPPDSWIVAVQGAYPRAKALLSGSTSTAVTVSGSVTPLQAIISLPVPFPYEPETEGGALGCANVVSAALVKAGVLPGILLLVRDVEAALVKRGWMKLSSNVQTAASDVIVWGEINGHPHIGICDGTGSAWQNSSKDRRVERISISGYSRPVESIYRRA